MSLNTDHKKNIIAILGSSTGNLVEWFDFYIYSFCAIYFAPMFFPSGDSTTQLLKTAGIFAAGFLMRPIGGWLFGRIADKYGRKSSLLISISMMCGGSLMIACTPTYTTIGVVAPILLLVARLLQGISVGGEYGTSATYMSEVAIRGHKGFYSSFQYVTLIGGQLSAVLVLVVLQQIFSFTELQAWGWRIPFFIGAITALIVFFIRKSLKETTTEETRNNKDAGSFTALWKHKSAFFTVIGFTAGGSLVFYTFTTYMQKYLINTVGIKAEHASIIMTGALVVFMLAQPIFGAFADKVGSRKSMLCFGSLTVIFTVPILHELKHVSNPLIAFSLITVALLIISFYTSIAALIKAEMFPMEVRALGVGFSYAIANALFGGSAEYVALSMKAHGYEDMFFWYVTVMCAISLFVSFKMKDTRKLGLLE